MSRYFATRLFDGDAIREDVTFSVEQGRIVALQEGAEAGDAVRLPGLVVPGFVDTQVNGGGGALFNTEPTVATLRTMMEAHSRYGTTAMLPTLISDRLDVMREAAEAIAVAIREKVPGIVGVHFEGPHLSGPKKGTHCETRLRPIGAEEMAIYTRKDLGTVSVTLAPELVAVEDIRKLADAGVKVCIGHSNADAGTTQAALQAGVCGFTHLYNAMSQLNSRAPGVVGAALASRDSWCGIIADGHHVDPLAMQVAICAKPQGKIMLVTDSMSTIGTDQQSFPFFGRTVYRDGDRLTSTTGELAGSALEMITAVRNIHEWCDVSLEEALRMAGRYPAEFAGIDAGVLAPGKAADFALLDDALEVQGTWIAGRQVFAAAGN